MLSSPFNLALALPVYDVYPTQCAKGTFTFEVVFVGSGSFPAFITQYPSSKINVMTQETSLAGAYNFKIKATESISGFTNTDDSFKCTIILPNYATSLSWITSTLIPDLTYMIGSTQVNLNSPLNNVLPTNADVKYSFTLGASTPSFITLVPQESSRP